MSSDPSARTELPKSSSCPRILPEASPLALIVATDEADELQLTSLVMSCVVPLEYVPVAVNCCVAPVKAVGLAGVTAIEVNTGGGPGCSTTSTQ